VYYSITTLGIYFYEYSQQGAIYVSIKSENQKRFISVILYPYGLQPDVRKS